MQQTKQIHELLNILTLPAFAVIDGTVTQVNNLASQRQVEPGMDIASLLHTGKEAYPDFTDGRLHLQVLIADTLWNASVTKTLGADIFLLESVADSQDLRMLSLAALQIRSPLAEISLLAEKLNKEEALKDSDIPARLNRSLLAMQRLIGNMADAPRYSRNRNCNMQTRNLTSFVREILDKSHFLFEAAGHKLEYTIPTEALYAAFSEERLERAIYNLLSNALKFSPKNGTVTVSLEKCGKMAMFTVSDEGNGLTEKISGDIFTRYLREPGLEDSRMGMGLGMLLVCSTASVHGGTVLVRQPEGKGLSVTMTISVELPTHGTMRSDILQIDYSGGSDHALLELADALPSELYKK